MINKVLQRASINHLLINVKFMIEKTM